MLYRIFTTINADPEKSSFSSLLSLWVSDAVQSIRGKLFLVATKSSFREDPPPLPPPPPSLHYGNSHIRVCRSPPRDTKIVSWIHVNFSEFIELWSEAHRYHYNEESYHMLFHINCGSICPHLPPLRPLKLLTLFTLFKHLWSKGLLCLYI